MLLADITTSYLRLVIEKKRNELYEERYNQLHQKFLATVDTSPISFFTIDETGIIEYMNDALAELLGGKKETLMGRNLLHILDPKCKTDFISELKFKGQANCLIKVKEGYRNALILGRETQNGHLTITGSVYMQ
jgi:PAS domain-containing protein